MLLRRSAAKKVSADKDIHTNISVSEANGERHLPSSLPAKPGRLR
jgi:hypothetical protein